jgi:hypothetical protein
MSITFLEDHIGIDPATNKKKKGMDSGDYIKMMESVISDHEVEFIDYQYQ